MSHFTTVKTRITRKEHLLQALRDFGFAWEEGSVTIRGYAGAYTHAEIRIPTRNKEYDIGFRQVGDAYECVADWGQIRGIKQEAFLQQLTQRYAYHAARARLEEQGFAVASEEKQKDGRIHLVLRRTA